MFDDTAHSRGWVEGTHKRMDLNITDYSIKTLPCALSSDLGHLLPRLGLVFGSNAGEANFDTSSSVASTPKCSEQITAFHLAQVR